MQSSVDESATQQHRFRVLRSVFITLGVMMLVSMAVVKTVGPAAVSGLAAAAAKSLRPAAAEDPTVQFRGPNSGFPWNRRPKPPRNGNRPGISPSRPPPTMIVITDRTSPKLPVLPDFPKAEEKPLSKSFLGAGSIATDLTKHISKLEGMEPADIPVKALQEVMVSMGKSFMQFGFNGVASDLVKNAYMLDACPGFADGATVDQCLQAEEGKQKALQDKAKGTPAKLINPSPAIGLLWNARLLGFMSEMFAGASNGETMYEAGMSAYEHRIKVAFAKGRLHPDYMVNKAVFNGLASGLKDEDQYYTLWGGKEVARGDMKIFSDFTLPVADGLFASIVRHKLDDSKGY